MVIINLAIYQWEESLLSNALHIVATPIGNLGDMTFRAVETLKKVDLIAAEDTRHSGKLLKHFDIQTPMLSLHDHNEAQRLTQLIQRLQNGENIALISDAGTPLIADPGYKLVRACHDNGITVIPVPGVSSVTSALSACGLPTDAVSFYGFLPAKSQARQNALGQIKAKPETLVFFESAKRLQKTLQDMQQIIGNDRLLCICRELTKLHEQIKLATIEEHLQDSMPTLGEFVLVLEGAMPQYLSEEELKNMINQLKGTIAPAKIAAQLSEQCDKSRQEIYQMILRN